MVMGWPVALRARSLSMTERSARRGVTFSMATGEMGARGGVWGWRGGEGLGGVAFVFDDGDLGGLGDEEVAAGHAQVSAAELVAQVLARLGGEGLGVLRVGDVEVFTEQLGDTLDILMDDGSDDVAG